MHYQTFRRIFEVLIILVHILMHVVTLREHERSPADVMLIQIGWTTRV